MKASALSCCAMGTALRPVRPVSVKASLRLAVPSTPPAVCWRSKQGPVRHVMCSAAAEMTPAVMPAARPAPSLYLLHWHDQAVASQTVSGPDAMTSSQDFVETLQKQIKAMEKVAKKAVWFTTTAAGDGQHVLMVTDNVKVARKYNLTPIPEGVANYSVALPGDVSVSVPVAAIMEARMKATDDSGSDSDDEPTAPTTMTTTATMTKEQKKKMKEQVKMEKETMKKMEKEEKKKKEKKMEEKSVKDTKAVAMEDEDSGSESGSDSEEDEMKGGMQAATPATNAMTDTTKAAAEKMMKGDESESSGSESESSEDDSDAEDCQVPTKKEKSE